MLWKSFLILLLSLIVIGCGTTSIESNKDPAYQKKLDRVFVSLSLKREFFDPQKAAMVLSEKLAQRGVSSQVFIRSQSEVGDSIKIKLEAYNPNQVMTVTTETVMSNQSGDLSCGLGVSMRDVATKKIVWHAAIWSGGIFSKSKTREDGLADAIIQKLDTDGLLPAP